MKFKDVGILQGREDQTKVVKVEGRLLFRPRSSHMIDGGVNQHL